MSKTLSRPTRAAAHSSCFCFAACRSNIKCVFTKFIKINYKTRAGPITNYEQLFTKVMSLLR